LVRAVLLETTPTMTILISAEWIMRAALLALIGALAGALYPAYRAARTDPVKALAYE
jgi:putative ABC transport system permease protein